MQILIIFYPAQKVNKMADISYNKDTRLHKRQIFNIYHQAKAGSICCLSVKKYLKEQMGKVSIFPEYDSLKKFKINL